MSMACISLIASATSELTDMVNDAVPDPSSPMTVLLWSCTQPAMASTP